MKRIVWAVRSIFCNHNWIKEELIDRDFTGDVDNVKVSVTCNKCGWHRSYWKFPT